MDPVSEDRTDSNNDVTMLTDYKSSKKKDTDEIVILDDSLTKNPMENTILIEDDSFCEIDTDATKTSITLEETLPPGDAPSGFVVIDEVYCENNGKEKSPVIFTESQDDEKPLISIHFRDNDVAGRYKKKFMTFLNDLIIKKNTDCMTQCKDLMLEVWGDLCNEVTETCNDSGKVSTTTDELESLFIVDTTPAVKDDLDIPTYGKKYDRILDKNSSVQKNTEIKERVSKLTCFNCMGKHNLKDCKEPRNQANINKNRKEFNAKQPPRSMRYHQEDEQKFGHLIPGKLSTNLRQALNLQENELPRHIYRMRQLGYPPGWLEEAKLQHSGLSLFNSEGVAEGDPEDEEGEIVNYENKDKYDIKKIIEFPGFNVRPSRGVYDECKQYWGSEIQIKNSMSSMLELLSDRKVDEGYKRKKLKKGAPIVTDSMVEPSEMDIEILDEEAVIETVPINGLFIPPLPKDDVKPPEPPQLPSEDSDGQDTLSPESMVEESTAPSSRAESPTLSDLEYAKKHILAELEDSNSQSNPENATKNNISLDSSASVAEISTPTSTEVSTPTPTEVTSQNTSQSKPNTPVSNRGSIKSIDLGTPILKSSSPYNKLPSSEKFSKDICDVIYFENLPDATGKYEKMSGIIQKVRSKLAEINKE